MCNIAMCPECGGEVVASVPNPMSAHILIRCSNVRCVCGRPPYHVYSFEELVRRRRMITLHEVNHG